MVGDCPKRAGPLDDLLPNIGEPVKGPGAKAVLPKELWRLENTFLKPMAQCRSFTCSVVL